MWNADKTWSFLKGALLATAGAVVATLTAYVGDADLGLYGPLLGAILSVLANAVRLAIQGEPTAALPARSTEDDGLGDI